MILNTSLVFHNILDIATCWANVKFPNGLCFCNLVGDMTDAAHVYNAGTSDNHAQDSAGAGLTLRPRGGKRRGRPV